ncbi:ring-hydroxylating dioxygenase, large terminal subunit [Chamaesiphon minutus PCC 6605]|uniref:Ring-hydroxylating dioxygenase, large terminal subunit n=1 Tax=Chamaesiphon minutus (strain ATCC 27169 / PCC 6605) TaxID=1173020 RepID=K9UQF2_CHAP6|nr:ring-hydroxylating dioxygenase, large terminal subunit [Chamaesiphon minutus PCC 6605]
MPIGELLLTTLKLVTESKQNFLRNIWYYALPAERIKAGQMLAKQLLGEPVVFGRTQAGEVFALRDICPHRAVPLSCGRFDGKEIECAYHGWRFDDGGTCTAIPALNDDRDLDLSKFQVRRYPVREVQGNIWIYMSDLDRCDEREPQQTVPEIAGFEGVTHQSTFTMKFPCFIDHAVVGLMDPSHVPFVHRAWWWRSDTILTDEIKAFDPSPYGFTMRRHRLERQTFFYRLLGGDAEVEIAFRLPGVRIEQIVTNTNRVCNLTVITPISETETEVTTMFYTTIPWFKPLRWLIQPFITTFLGQDRDMVVKQQIGLKYNPPLMLIRDADTQAIWYYQLRAEYLKSIGEDREFSNPVKSQILHWRS